MIGFLPVAMALKSDREQAAIIDADGVDIDFARGLRVYYGNVKLRQGTLRLDADKLEVRFDDGELQSAYATGEPAVFRQRPDGKDVDVVGEALFIHLDEVENIVTLTRSAVLTQGADSVAGNTIVYNMATDNMQVRSGGDGSPTRTTKAAEDGSTTVPDDPVVEAPTQSTSSTTTTAGSGTADSGSGTSTESEGSSVDAASEAQTRRPRIVIKPKEAE